MDIKITPQENLAAPNSWRKVVKQRKTGKSAGKFDTYFYSPDGKQFRSRKTLQKYLDDVCSSLFLDQFNFKHSYEESIESIDFPSASSMELCVPQTHLSEKLFSNKALKFSTTSQLMESYPGELNKSIEVTDGISVNYKYQDKKEDPPSVVQGSKNTETVSRKKGLRKHSHYFMKTKTSGLVVPKFFNKESSVWIPPRSPFNLIQENLFHNPWKLLVATICLQKTTGAAVYGTLNKFFLKFPTPQSVVQANESDIADTICNLGLGNKRAKILKRFSDEYINKKWNYPIELYGIGKYGNDSYRIFCVNEWKQVNPKDHMLDKYYKWLKLLYET